MVNSPLLRVMSLHALAYCERLFYLEEVENLRIADASVYAGRRLHVELAREEEDDDWITLNLQSESLGLIGKIDCLRKRDGLIIPYEHKRGRAARSKDGAPEAWKTDRLQLIAYALLVEEHLGKPITEGRIRYHSDNVTVRVKIDEEARADLSAAIQRAQDLRDSLERPPITDNEKLCVKCSLAPACLPEETRLAQAIEVNPSEPDYKTVKLFPSDDERMVLHVTTQGAKVGRKGDRFEIWMPDEQASLYPSREIGQVVLHGFSQISTQALRLCTEQEIGVHWLTSGGSYVGTFSTGIGSVQRRIRQYRALSDPEMCLKLSKKLVEAKVRSQLGLLLRANRERGDSSVNEAIAEIRRLLSPLTRVDNIDSLRGYEGMVGARYFSVLPKLVLPEIGESMRPSGRSRRPPEDRFNALLSFGYALLLKDVMNAILIVGLEPSLGFYHQPRSQAQPLALDIMELFRVMMVDLPVLGSVNRRQWDEDLDFEIAGNQVWLSDAGRKKYISLYERRKADQWRHPVIGHSLSYSRLLELEVRLLEKEWTDLSPESRKPINGLFARMRLR